MKTFVCHSPLLPLRTLQRHIYTSKNLLTVELSLHLHLPHRDSEAGLKLAPALWFLSLWHPDHTFSWPWKKIHRNTRNRAVRWKLWNQTGSFLDHYCLITVSTSDKESWTLQVLLPRSNDGDMADMHPTEEWLDLFCSSNVWIPWIQPTQMFVSKQ